MRSLIRILSSALLLGAFLMGCGTPKGQNAEVSKPNPTPQARKGEYAKPGKAFRAFWTWTQESPELARVSVNVVPTVPGTSLSVNAKLPDGVLHQGGELLREVSSPKENTPAVLDFTIHHPAEPHPTVRVEVMMVIGEGRQSSATILVRDPAAPPPTREEYPGTETNLGGRRGKIAGQAEKK